MNVANGMGVVLQDHGGRLDSIETEATTINSMNDIGQANQQLTLSRGDMYTVRMGPNTANPYTNFTIGTTVHNMHDINGTSAMAIVTNGNLHIDALQGRRVYMNIVSGGGVIGPRGQQVNSGDRWKKMKNSSKMLLQQYQS